MTRLLVLASAVLLGGCASIVKGTDQNIVVNTNPPGAACTFTREGETLGVVNPTPGTVNVDKSSADISLACEKDGYVPAQYIIDSETESMTVGNVLAGGVIGLAVDASTGAMNKYDTNVTVTLQKEE